MSATAQRKRSIFDDSDDSGDDESSLELKKSKSDREPTKKVTVAKSHLGKQSANVDKRKIRLLKVVEVDKEIHESPEPVHNPTAALQTTKDDLPKIKETTKPKKKAQAPVKKPGHSRPASKSTLTQNKAGDKQKETKGDANPGPSDKPSSPEAHEPPSTPEKSEGDAGGEELPLSPAQRARMEQKRQLALLIRQDKMNRKNPYYMKTEEKEQMKVLRINNTKLIDTGAGFFLEETPGLAQEDLKAAMQMVTEPVPLFEDERPRCLECHAKFYNSFLVKNFSHDVCDECRDTEDKHTLITKTDSCTEYLLKDVDLEKRQPTLKFIIRKNPHNSRWGDMKLYLKLQVEKRALEVWGSEEGLEEALAKKDEQREVNKQKKFKKKMKELRMNVRSSLYTRATKTHQHEYGEEEYMADEDEYSRTCLTCGHSYTYDKL